MSDDPSSNGSAPRSWLEKIGQVFSGEPRNREELLEELRNAQHNGLMSQDTLAMMEGAITIADKVVGDVMVPRAQMVCCEVDASLPEIVKLVVESGHSRFPVIGDDRDEVVGILLAKDLLKCFADGTQPCNIRALLRKVALVPEQKPLSVLLTEFRGGRQHMAIVVDEFGATAGLVTIEDVLEEIVGDISDEHDDEPAGSTIQQLADGRYLVNALTTIEAFNERLGTKFEDDEFDTVGGLVTARFGHLPAVGEETSIEGLHFKVAKADSRRVHLISVRNATAA